MKIFLLSFFVFCLSLTGLAQNQQTAVFFDTDKADLKTEAQQSLDQLAMQLAQMPDYEWRIEAHTDNTGSNTYNEALAQRRGAAVMQYLAAKGLHTSNGTTVAFGERKQKTDNATEDHKQLNRRVDVIVTPIVINSFEDLTARLLGNNKNVFTISPDIDQKVTARDGTVLNIPANSFVNAEGEPVTGLVQIEIIEAYKPLDWISYGLTTNSDNRLLETGGMVQIKASQNGQPLTIAEDSDLTLGIPTNGKPFKQDMELFYADNATGGMNWKATNNRFKRRIEIEEDTFRMKVDQVWYDRIANMQFEKAYAPEKPQLGAFPAKPLKPTMPYLRSKPKAPSIADVYKRYGMTDKSSASKRKKADAEFANLNANYEKAMLSYEKDKLKYERLMTDYNSKMATYTELSQQRDEQLNAFLRKVQVYQMAQYKYVFFKNLPPLVKGGRKRLAKSPKEFAYAAIKLTVRRSMKELNVENSGAKTIEDFQTDYDNIAPFVYSYCQSQLNADYYELRDTIYKKMKALYQVQTIPATAHTSQQDRSMAKIEMQELKVSSLIDFQTAISEEYERQYKASPASTRIERQRLAQQEINEYNSKVRDSIGREQYLAYLQTPAGKRALEKAGVDQYVTKISQMGWINCDRFQNVQTTQYELAVTESEQGAKIYIMMQDYDGMMSFSRKNDQVYSCKNLPVGAQATLVAIKVNNGKVEFSAQPITIQNQNIVVKPTYKTMSMDQLRVELEKLNS